MPWSLFYECWVLGQFFHSPLYFHQEAFSSSSLSAIRVVSSAYLKLLKFVPKILIPACTSPSLAFCMMYSAYKLNKQNDNIQPWHTPFPIRSQPVVPCTVLTIASWPTYRFLPGEGNGNPLQYSCLKNPMDRGAWQAIVHGVTKSRTQLSNYTTTTTDFSGGR